MTVDLSAIAKWPNVPACYGWLSLDQRGNWRLQGEPVSHHGLIAFMNRQYGSDESGCWFVQNGPQRVFVELAYTPWVFRREGDSFISHTGQAAGVLKAVYIDEEGNILLETALGIGLLDDRDLPTFLDQCRQKGNVMVNEKNWLKLISGESADTPFWDDLPLQLIRRNDVASRFRFQQTPQVG